MKRATVASRQWELSHRVDIAGRWNQVVLAVFGGVRVTLVFTSEQSTLSTLEATASALPEAPAARGSVLPS